jgi:hypothetical protein
MHRICRAALYRGIAPNGLASRGRKGRIAGERQSMAPEYGPRDLHVALSRLSKVQIGESFAQSVIKCPDLVQTMLRKAEGRR